MSQPLKITILGTGTSIGVPVIACNCEVCTSTDPRDNRLRTSVLIEYADDVIVIDTGPDFRQQMLQHKVSKLSAILFTHEHRDHVAGLDDVRAFNFKLKRHIDVYAEDRVQQALMKEYDYIFAENKYPGVPRVNVHRLENKELTIGDLTIMPIRLMHHELPIFGFRIGDFAYMTDMKTIPQSELHKLGNLKAMVVTALRKEEHISHMNVEEALQLINLVKPEMAYLTHLNHTFGLHAVEEPMLPKNVKIAYDGLEITLDS